MHEPLTKMQTWLLRAWVYGVILGFLGAASLYGPFTPDRIAYKVARFLLVLWVLISFDRRGNMGLTLVKSLIKFTGIGVLVVAALLSLTGTVRPNVSHPILNLLLASAVLAMPVGAVLGLYFTNSAARRRALIELDHQDSAVA